MSSSQFYQSAFGVEPGRVVVAASVDEVADAVRAANAVGEAVIPWSGGAGQTYGYLPRRADVLLDLARLNRVVAVEPGDLTITVEGGATLADVQGVLALHNQFLPLDPPDAETATIGGILATNAFGPSLARFGGARDWLIGITVVDAAGRLVRGGGKVVKNVTGYDLPKMHVGALGTLGVIVQATFKVAPRPDTGRAALFALPIDDAPKAAEFVAALLAKTAPALGLVREMAGARVLALIYSGMDEVVDAEHAAAERIAAEHGMHAIGTAPAGMDRPFAATGTAGADSFLMHLVGTPAAEVARHAAFADHFGSLVRRLDTFPGTGRAEIHLTGGEDADVIAQEAVSWAQGAAAHLSFWQAPVAVRDPTSRIPLWSPLPPAFPLMRRLKEMLDPNGTLNPGRFIGGL